MRSITVTRYARFGQRNRGDFPFLSRMSSQIIPRIASLRRFVRNISRDCRPLSRRPQYIKLYLLPSPPIAENADFECEVSTINFWRVLAFGVRL